MSHPFDLPPPQLAEAQAEWLAAARSRLFRRVQIATLGRVLELGSGHGLVAAELERRAGGRAVGLDRRLAPLAAPAWPAGVLRVCADAERLPFADRSFDLVFCQWMLLWMEHPSQAVAEVARVLAPGAHFLAIEPDFGGLIEDPSPLATRELWLAGLSRAGAEPLIARRLPAILAAAGFEVRVDLLERLTPPSPLRLELLAGLPLTVDERSRLSAIQQADAAIAPQAKVVHLPMFLITARVKTS